MVDPGHACTCVISAPFRSCTKAATIASASSAIQFQKQGRHHLQEKLNFPPKRRRLSTTRRVWASNTPDSTQNTTVVEGGL